MSLFHYTINYQLCLMNYVILQNYCPTLPFLQSIKNPKRKRGPIQAARLFILPQEDRLQTTLDLFFYISHNDVGSALRYSSLKVLLMNLP